MPGSPGPWRPTPFRRSTPSGPRSPRRRRCRRRRRVPLPARCRARRERSPSCPADPSGHLPPRLHGAQMLGHGRSDRWRPLEEPDDRLLDLVGRGAVAGQPLHLDAVTHRQVRGQPRDAEVPADLAVLRRVHGQEPNAVPVRRRERLDGRHQREARLTFRSPDVDQDGTGGAQVRERVDGRFDHGNVLLAGTRNVHRPGNVGVRTGSSGGRPRPWPPPAPVLRLRPRAAEATGASPRPVWVPSTTSSTANVAICEINERGYQLPPSLGHAGRPVEAQSNTGWCRGRPATPTSPIERNVSPTFATATRSRSGPTQAMLVGASNVCARWSSKTTSTSPPGATRTRPS